MKRKCSTARRCFVSPTKPCTRQKLGDGIGWKSGRQPGPRTATRGCGKTLGVASSETRGSSGCGKTPKSAAGDLKGRGFSHALQCLKDLRHGWEAVPLQN